MEVVAETTAPPPFGIEEVEAAELFVMVERFCCWDSALTGARLASKLAKLMDVELTTKYAQGDVCPT